MSDFPRAVARVSEGFCPLCDGQLERIKTVTSARLDTVIVDPASGQGAVHLSEMHIEPPGYCEPCAIGWDLDTSMGASQPMLRPSRALTPEETKALFNRPKGGSHN